MSLFSPPSTPDPQTGIALGQQVAQGQQGYNTTAGETSQAGSMVDQSNPYGSLTYSQTGTGPNGVPLYSANVSLSPQQQSMFDALQGTKTAAGQQGNALITNANYGATDPTTAIGNSTNGETSTLLSQFNQSQQPFFTTQRSQLDTQLRNQGLAPGNPAYDNAMRGMDTSITNAEAGATAQFEPQAFSQAQTLYQEPATLGENLATFGAPGDPTSDLVNAPALNVQPANLIGATGTETSALNQNYQAQNQQYQNMMSGIFGVPSAILGGWAKGGFPGLSSASSLFGGAADSGAAAAAGMGDAASSAALLGDLGAMAMI